MNIKNKFTELYHEYKIILHAFVIGAGIGILITTFVFLKAQPDVPKTKPTPTVTTNKGSPLRVNKIQSDKDKITLNTSYDGAGESVITVPSESIPSAWAYDHEMFSVIALYGTGNHIAIGAGVRYKRITFMALPFVKVGNSPEIGILAGVSYSFQSWF